MNEAEKEARVAFYTTLGLVGLGLVLRLLMLDAEGLWYDEALTALSLRLPFGDMVKERLSAGHSPLYFAILYPFARVFGTGEMVVRLPSVAASTLSIYIFYLLAKRLFGNGDAAFSASLIYSFSALNIYFAQEARMYAFCVLFAVMSFYYLVGALDGNGWKEWVPYLGSTLVLVYLSAATVPVLFAQLVYVLLSRRRIVPFLVAGAAVVALYLPMGIFYLRMGRLGFIEWLAPIRVRTYLELFYGFGLRPIPAARPGVLFGMYLRTLEVLTLLMVCGSVGLGIWYNVARKKAAERASADTHEGAFLLVLSWLFVPLLVLTVYSYVKQPMLGPKRYVYMLAPAFYLLLAYGLHVLRRTVIRRAVTIVMLVLFCTTLVQYYLTPTREDWRGAVRYLTDHLEQGEVLFGDLSTQVMYRYYGMDESTIIMDIRYMSDIGFGRGWVLMRKHDYDRLSPYLANMKQYYEVSEKGPFYGLRLIHFRVD